jgi:hypothetical protein
MTTVLADSTTAEDADALVSPLTEVYRLLYAYDPDVTPEADQKKSVDAARAREDLIAQCMKEEGFEYIPNLGVVDYTVIDFREPDNRSWVSQYGYGLMESPFQYEITAAMIKAMTDPNADYIASLDAAGRVEYRATLGGTDSVPGVGGIPARGGGADQPWAGIGCAAWARQQVADEVTPLVSQFKPLLEAADRFEETVARDGTAFEELDGEWQACMADAGQPSFQRQANAYQCFADERERPYVEAIPSFWQTDFDTHMQDPQFAVLFEEEVSLALADLDCREQVNYRTRYDEIRWVLEAEFVSDHQDEVDALRLAAEQAPPATR